MTVAHKGTVRRLYFNAALWCFQGYLQSPQNIEVPCKGYAIARQAQRSNRTLTPKTGTGLHCFGMN